MRGSCSTDVAVAVAKSWATIQNGSNNAELSGSRPSINNTEPTAGQASTTQNQYPKYCNALCDVLLEHTLDAKREC